MKSIKCDKFLDQLTYHQMLDFSAQINSQIQQEVMPIILGEMIAVPFYHYMEIKDRNEKSLFVSCLMVYVKENGRVKRTIETVKIYENEEEMNLYIGVRAYERITSDNVWIFQ